MAHVKSIGCFETKVYVNKTGIIMIIIDYWLLKLAHGVIRWLRVCSDLFTFLAVGTIALDEEHTLVMWCAKLNKENLQRTLEGVLTVILSTVLTGSFRQAMRWPFGHKSHTCRDEKTLLQTFRKEITLIHCKGHILLSPVGWIQQYYMTF